MEVNSRPSKYFFESYDDAEAYYNECCALYESGELAGFSIVFYEKLTCCSLEKELAVLRSDYPEYYEQTSD